MGKAGRFVCVFIPMVLTIASLVFQIIVGLGGTNANNSYLSNIYFLQANATAAAHNSSLINFPANNMTDPADKTADGKIILENFYAIGLWGYCAGSGANTTGSLLALGQTTAQSVDFCTAKQLHFWFDPRTVWGFTGSFANNMFTNDLNNALGYYEQTASKWISTLFILAVVSTAVEILVGIGGLFSRLGSIFTTLASLVTGIFLWSFTILATVTYVGLGSAFNVALKNYGITFYLGRTMFIYMWLAVACSFVSGIFWAFSSCCCSGRSRESAYNKGTIAQRTPYTYESIDGPAAQYHPTPMNNVGGRPTAYEPFRHGN
ncbi:hypothetical protein MMC26_007303 [Xylographa opegraphella]|nr:hypothetical protein [Xylographa opegraphella]